MKNVILTFVAAAISCFGQVQFIQHAAATSSTTTATTTATDFSACTPHCLVVLCASASAQAVSSSPANTWSLVDAGNGRSMYIALNATVSASDTFTVTSNGSKTAIAAMGFSGVASGPDQFHTGANNGTTSTLGSGLLTPTNANELVTSCLVTNATSPTLSAGMTLVDTAASGGGTAASGYQIQTTATAINPTWTVGFEGLSTTGATFYSTMTPATLTFNTTTLAEGFVSVAYNFPFNISGGVAPNTCTQTGGTLPTGLSLSGCSIVGTPTGAGTTTGLTFHVVDSASNTVDSGSLSIVIAATALSISTSSLPGGTQYSTYSSSIAAAGGTSPYTYSWLIVGTTLPATCSVSSVFGIYIATSANVNIYECISTNNWVLQTSGTSFPASLPEGMAINSSSGALTSSLLGCMGYYGVRFTAVDAQQALVTKILPIQCTGSSAWMANIFEPNDIAYTRVDATTSGLPVDTSPAANLNSSHAIFPVFGAAASGLGNTPWGIPATEVPYNQTYVSVTTGPFQSYFSTAPIPSYAPSEASQNAFKDKCPEGGSGEDGHVLVYQEPNGGTPGELFEFYQGCNNFGASGWYATSNANWNVSSYATTPLCPNNSPCSTTAAAGTRILPHLLNVDEIIGSGSVGSPNGTITHSTSVRMSPSSLTKYYTWPATSNQGGNSGGSFVTCAGATTTYPISQSVPPASCSANATTYGEIMRLKASVYASLPTACTSATSPFVYTIMTGFYQYGLIVTDNTGSGGPNGEIDGVPDARWPDAAIAACFSKIPLTDFEPVNVSSLIISTSSFQAGGGAGTLPGTPSCPTTTGTQYSAYSSSTSSSTGTTPITYSVSFGALPSGISLVGSTGVIAGTPTGGGTSAFQLIGTNVAGNSATPASCTITISPLSPSIVGNGGIISVGTLH